MWGDPVAGLEPGTRIHKLRLFRHHGSAGARAATLKTTSLHGCVVDLGDGGAADQRLGRRSGAFGKQSGSKHFPEAVTRSRNLLRLAAIQANWGFAGPRSGASRPATSGNLATDRVRCGPGNLARTACW